MASHNREGKSSTRLSLAIGYLFSALEIRFLFFETNFVKVLIPFIGVRI